MTKKLSNQKIYFDIWNALHALKMQEVPAKIQYNCLRTIKAWVSTHESIHEARTTILKKHASLDEDGNPNTINNAVQFPSQTAEEACIKELNPFMEMESEVEVWPVPIEELTSSGVKISGLILDPLIDIFFTPSTNPNL